MLPLPISQAQVRQMPGTMKTWTLELQLTENKKSCLFTLSTEEMGALKRGWRVVEKIGKSTFSYFCKSVVVT